MLLCTCLEILTTWMNVSASSESRKGAPRSLTSGQPSRRRLIRNPSVPRHMHGSGESWVVCRGCQTRLDLLVLVGLPSTGQASPKPGHEKALRMVLRYLITDMKVGQRFPTEGELSDYAETLLSYTDAGFAPMRSTNRRSVSCVSWCAVESVQPASGIGDLEFVRGRAFRRPGRHPGRTWFVQDCLSGPQGVRSCASHLPLFGMAHRFPEWEDDPRGF